MVSLELEIKHLLEGHQLIEPGETLVVGVSGGPDSIALIHILCAVRDLFFFTPVAVYVDHGLRPSETPDEINCVCKAADRLGIACKIVKVDTLGLVKTQKLSLEHAARELRYSALRTCALEYGGSRIAVAHTADDQVEELLLRLLRGSGRKGLAGMLMQQKDIIRPLLATNKKTVLRYLEENEIPCCHDSSNDDLRFLRNRVRHLLLPVLEKEFDSGIHSSLLKTAATFSEDEAYLEIMLDKIWTQVVTRADEEMAPVEYTVHRNEFISLHPCLQRRLVERLLWKMGSCARYKHILAVVQAAGQGRTSSELHLSKGLRVGIWKHTLEFSYPQGKKAWRGRLRDQN